MKKFVSNTWLLMLLFAVIAIFSCKKEDPPEVISGFTFTVDAADFKKVVFTNASQNYKTVSWDFGDGTAVSTETNPSHTYAAIGTYTVKLTATGDGGTDVSTQSVVLADPDAELTKLVGATSKTWKLLRKVNANRWPLEVGPIAKTEVWWAQGRQNDEIALRPCIMNDEWIFSRDFKMQYKTNGDFWAEGGGLFSPDNICAASTPANMKGPAGEDNSAWGDGTHTFVLVNGANPTLEVKGLGAFIGLPKIGTDTEVKVPQTSVKFDIIKMVDGPVADTLILESKYKFAAADPADGAYWKVTLVHYDNAADEPAIPAPSPQPIFTAAQDQLTLILTNNSKYSDSYLWDFGDGSTSTEASPTHTYAAAGVYKVKLTATNAVASLSLEQEFTMKTGVILESDILGGAWKVRKEANSVYVGPGLGSNAWFVIPLDWLDGTQTGVDNFSCILNDEFTFTAGGKFEYKTNGDVRNDGYMGAPNGCWSDAQVAASGNGAAFLSGVHSFTFTPAAGSKRPLITLTNGAAGAAFIGFYKGYYGGENGAPPSPTQPLPNGGNATNQYEIISYEKVGGVETLIISVDISAAHDGSAAWSAVLVR